MELGPFYTGQVPRDPLSLVVRDGGTNRVIDLTGYSYAEVVIADPDGYLVDMSSSVITMPLRSSGEVRCDFGGSSPFLTAGDYQLQLKLFGPNVQDITVPTTFEVHRQVGA